VKKLYLAGMLVAALGALAGQVRASSHCCQPVPTCVKWCEKTVTCYRQEWHTKQVPTTLWRKQQRIIEVPCRYTVHVPRPVMEKQCEVYYKQVLKPVCFEVAKTKSVPYTEKDPCTGCCKTCYKMVCYTEKVCSTVSHVVPEIRECLVEVNHFIPQDHDYTSRHHVTIDHPETILHTVRYCVMIPYEKKVLVPVHVPCCEQPAAPACAPEASVPASLPTTAPAMAPVEPVSTETQRPL